MSLGGRDKHPGTDMPGCDPRSYGACIMGAGGSDSIRRALAVHGNNTGGREDSKHGAAHAAETTGRPLQRNGVI
ncbi:hypothetical protein RRF57_000566 [Xylaria bambusicola]|uniref:Uncharacterized protein n=1 Tax=Xylaria bambusicola TaxID=326684 RepID=A0AAN7U417_9PEZI